MNLQEKEFISSYFGLSTFSDDRKSCFLISLRSARKFSGRNPQTGIEEHGLCREEIFMEELYYSHIFTGLTMYLILLDQIGLLFRNPSVDNKDVKNGIRLALESFTELNRNEIFAIKALRNSLAHNFGLAMTDEVKNYKFSLDYSKTDFVVKVNSEWNGDFSDKDESTSTCIGVKKLIEIIESIISKLKLKLLKNSLELRIENIEEIKTRFTIV